MNAFEKFAELLGGLFLGRSGMDTRGTAGLGWKTSRGSVGVLG